MLDGRPMPPSTGIAVVARGMKAAVGHLVDLLLVEVALHCPLFECLTVLCVFGS